jgi:hypothetical protein
MESVLIDSRYKSSGDTSNFTAVLNYPIVGKSKVSMGSIHLKNRRFNIKDDTSALYLSMVVYDDPTAPDPHIRDEKFSVTVPQGNYSELDLCTALNTAIPTAYSAAYPINHPITVDVTYSDVTLKFTISVTSTYGRGYCRMPLTDQYNEVLEVLPFIHLGLSQAKFKGTLNYMMGFTYHYYPHFYGQAKSVYEGMASWSITGYDRSKFDLDRVLHLCCDVVRMDHSNVPPKNILSSIPLPGYDQDLYMEATYTKKLTCTSGEITSMTFWYLDSDYLPCDPQSEVVILMQFE